MVNMRTRIYQKITARLTEALEACAPKLALNIVHFTPGECKDDLRAKDCSCLKTTEAFYLVQCGPG